MAAVTAKYDVEVALIGTDGNAFAIIGAVTKALKAAGEADGAAEFQAAAIQAGSYDELLQLVMATVEVV